MVNGNDPNGSDQDGGDTNLEVPPALGVMGLQGHIDAIESGRVYGWAWNPEQPEDRVQVDIYVKDRMIDSVLADRFRQDLVDVKVGDGIHAFVFDLPADARDADPSSISVYFRATQMPLSRGQKGKLPAPGWEADPVATLSGRIDRIETSVQQVFRALHIIRRTDDDLTRAAETEELKALQKSVSVAADQGESLAERVETLETTTNAVQSYIDRFELEIYDRVMRQELDDVREEISRVRFRQRVTGYLLLLTILGLGYLLYERFGAGLGV